MTLPSLILSTIALSSGLLSSVIAQDLSTDEPTQTISSDVATSLTALPTPTGSSILQNGDFSTVSGDIPGGWNLTGSGSLIPLPDGSQAFQLQSDDPNNPAQLSQNVPTVPGQGYNLSFQAFHAGDSDANEPRNFSVGFGNQVYNPTPGPGWEQYSFGAAGTGPNDQVVFNTYDQSGGSYVINQIFLTPSNDGSPTIFESSSSIDYPVPTIILQQDEGGSDALSTAELVGAIIGPILGVLTLAGGAFAWYWNERKERLAAKKDEANEAPVKEETEKTSDEPEKVNPREERVDDKSDAKAT